MNKIAVIGAGVSGLMMAKLLMEKGYEVMVFEAKNQIGGRVKEGFFQHIPIDLGGQWLHQIADKENVLTQILKEKEVKLIPDSKDETSIILANGSYSNIIPSIVQNFFEYMTENDFSEDQSLAESIANYSPDPFLKHFLEAFVCDMATSTRELSSKGFCELAQAFVPDDFLLKDTTMYNFIKDYFWSILYDNIHLNTPIVAIHYTKKGVVLQSLKGDSFEFQKCIISVPISQLQRNKISFSPPLPNDKIQAFKKIGMGMGLKVILFFNEELFLQTHFNAVHAPYYTPMQYDEGKTHAVITLLMGDYATAYYQDTEKGLKNIVKEIGALSGKKSEELLLDVIVQDWTKEPYIEGTYSFSMVSEGNAREIASESINDVLFFIGEAMNTKHGNGFIHGAMDTAVELAKKF